MNVVRFERVLSGGQRIRLIEGDITAEKVDAIVNAANSELRHGGGVAGAISRQGGPTIQKESDEWVRLHGRVTHAQPAYTSGGSLPARYVIHAVGPVWGEGDEDRKLSDAVRGSLQAADQLHLKTISMPAISTGIFGYPMERAADVIVGAIAEYFSTTPESGIGSVGIVLNVRQAVQLFRSKLEA